MPSKYLRTVIFCLAAFAANSSMAAPEFLGVLTNGEKTYVVLRDDSGKNLSWTAVGERVGDYTIVSYDPAAETLVLKQGDALIKLTLKSALIETAPTLALLESHAKQGNRFLNPLLEGARALELKRNQSAEELRKAEAEAGNGGRVVDLRRRLERDEKHLAFYLQRVLTASRRETEKTAP